MSFLSIKEFATRCGHRGSEENENISRAPALEKKRNLPYGHATEKS